MKSLTAFYFRATDAKRWKLIGICPSAEEAWVAAIELKGNGDLWFPQLPPDEPAETELTNRQFLDYRVRPLTSA